MTMIKKGEIYSKKIRKKLDEFLTIDIDPKLFDNPPPKSRYIQKSGSGSEL